MKAFQRLGNFSAVHLFDPDAQGFPETSQTLAAPDLLQLQHLFHHPLPHPSYSGPKTGSLRTTQVTLPPYQPEQTEQSTPFGCSSGSPQQETLPIAIWLSAPRGRTSCSFTKGSGRQRACWLSSREWEQTAWMLFSTRPGSPLCIPLAAAVAEDAKQQNTSLSFAPSMLGHDMS